MVEQARGLLANPSIRGILDAPEVPQDITKAIQPLLTLSQLTKVSADQKHTLKTLEQVLSNLQARIEEDSPQTVEQLTLLLQQEAFSPLSQLVGSLTSPFANHGCR